MADDRPTIDETLERIDRGGLRTRPEQRAAFTRDVKRPATVWERIKARIPGTRSSPRDTGRRPTR